jgi:ataxia telangiectasia mutated family protein
MKPTEASALLLSVRKEGGNQASLLLKAFADIRKRFKPIMRHYFTELHKAPTAWFAIRLNYARSVATTSIVGHVLGLGDRHTSNILMDNGSGEVVHIDLGIAFDQVCRSLLRVFPLYRSPHRANSCPSPNGCRSG